MGGLASLAAAPLLLRWGMPKALLRRHAGSHVVHPATGEAVPIWVADYVLGSYGSGAVMAVPAHDARDFGFAQQYGLPVVRVVQGQPDEEAELPFTGVLL